MNYLCVILEGSPCNLKDGTDGICKKIDDCQPIKEGIKRGSLGFESIVVCSFLVISNKICCSIDVMK